MLCSCPTLGIQALFPSFESGYQAVRHASKISTNSGCCSDASTYHTKQKSKPPKPIKVPLLPSLIDRMMPWTSILSSSDKMNIVCFATQKENRSFLQKFLTQNATVVHQSTRHFKIPRPESVKDEKSESKPSVSRQAIDESIHYILKSYDLSSKNATMLRLGIEEGLQLASKSVKKDLEKKSSKKRMFSSSEILQIVLFSFIIYFIYKRLPPGFPGLKKFQSAEEKGMISDVTFSDVCGIDEVKEEMQDIIAYLKDPEKFTKVGAKLPKGILLVGPPGTGKTLVAKAVAGEAGVPFFYAAGSEFDEMFVGVGAARIRQLFEKARAQSPSIIFIDEIDACGSKRVNSSLQPYARNTINQLLQEMDGFDRQDAVIVLGATNTGEVLDKALTRPGRFDQKITFLLPDIKGRKETLFHYVNKLGNVPDLTTIDLDRIASLSHGMSGADLNNLVNQAALRATKLNRTMIEQDDLEFSLDKARMGPELKTRVKTEEELQKTSYHEAGHALVAYYTPAAMRIYKATINQRGGALGHVSLIPKKEMENTQSKEQLIAMLDVAMGGRVAEELINGKDHVETGASSDIENATVIAYKLVCQYGMSDKLGLMKYDLDSLSQETKRLVEMEVKDILDKSYQNTKRLLMSRPLEHKLLAQALLRYETLTMTDIKVLFDSKDLNSVERLRKIEERAKMAKKKETSISLSAPVIDYVPNGATEVN